MAELYINYYKFYLFYFLALDFFYQINYIFVVLINFTDEHGDVPQEYLISKYELADLCSESAKLKSLGAMAIVPPERLVRLLNILEKNIRDGAKVTPIVDDVRSLKCFVFN